MFIPTGTKGLVKVMGEIGNNGMGKDYLKYVIVNIDQNTKKIHRDLKRLGITQSPVINHQLTLMRKTLKV